MLILAGIVIYLVRKLALVEQERLRTSLAYDFSLSY
jgi:hypothetical protein